MSVIGASPSPTPYKIRIPKEEYVRCGADILLNAVGHDLEGEAKCTVCGRSTHIEINQGKINKLDPAGAVLHVVEIRIPGQNAQIACSASPLFDKDECLRTWLKSYNGPQGRIYSLPEFIPRASELVSERVGPGLEPENGSPKVLAMSLQEYMAQASEHTSGPVRPARPEPEKQSTSGSVQVIRCADCGCSPAECSISKSATACPSCWLESCCCWVAPTSIA